VLRIRVPRALIVRLSVVLPVSHVTFETRRLCCCVRVILCSCIDCDTKVPFLPRLVDDVLCEQFFTKVLEGSDFTGSRDDLDLLYGMLQYDDDDAETANQEMDSGNIEDLD